MSLQLDTPLCFTSASLQRKKGKKVRVAACCPARETRIIQMVLLNIVYSRHFSSNPLSGVPIHSRKIWACIRLDIPLFPLSSQSSSHFPSIISSLFTRLSHLLSVGLCGDEHPESRKVILVWSSVSVLSSAPAHCDVLTHQRADALRGWELQDVTWDL